MSSRFDLGPPPRLAYAGSGIDRAAQLRAAEAFDDKAGAYALVGESVVLKKAAGGMDPLFTLGEARKLAAPGEIVFLGLRDGAPRYGVALDANAADALKSAGLLVIDLRSIAVQGLIGPDHLAEVAEAKAMLLWHARHRFCSNCGMPTVVSEAGWKRDCPSCKTMHFPRTDPVAIMLAINGDRCLLGRQARFGTGMWSCLAGFIEPGETIEDAVRRETFEEAGIVCGNVRYFASQPWPFPMSLMIGAHAQALSVDIKVDTSELEDARWFSRDEAAAMLMKTHTQGLSTPPPIAIAHHIIRAWVEGASVG